MSRSFGPPTVMVIDDSEIVLSVTRNVLEGAGYRVVTHPRPAGCVALILQEKPELVLIDVNMPLIGGDTIVKLFGKARPNNDTIVLLYSSLSQAALEAKVKSSGAHGFIQKTEDGHDFLRQLNLVEARDNSSSKLRAAQLESNEDDPSLRPSGAHRRTPAPATERKFGGNVGRAVYEPQQRHPRSIFRWCCSSMTTWLRCRRCVARSKASLFRRVRPLGHTGCRRILSARRQPGRFRLVDAGAGRRRGLSPGRRSDPNGGTFVFVTGAGIVPEIAASSAASRGSC